MRKVLLTVVAAVAVAAPAQARDGAANGRELKLSGTVVRVSADAISVESATHAVLTCAVPERLAQRASGFVVGDAVRMFCVRYRGRRAQLLSVQRTKERPKPAAQPAKERPAEKPAPAEKPVEKTKPAREQSG